MADDEETEPIQLGKRTLDAIIDGVAAKLREAPPRKRSNNPGAGPGTSTDAGEDEP